ncbi:unnamed protein product [Paramecium octaurelia]|uniref:Uncharacterized protein n=1 Tax=Paramecium octaurelia TaxID=43137 RepID=A0A8S1T2V5_PAROT|nr:unnamed protein product [Paramecium octaurelia]
MKVIQRFVVMLYQINGLGFSIYYYSTSSENSNLAYLILQSILGLILLYIQTKNQRIQYIGNIIIIQFSLFWQVITNQRNIQYNSEAQVIIAHFLTTQLFQDFKRFQQQQGQLRYRLIWFLLLLQSTFFQILYISQTSEIDLCYCQGIISLLLSFVINYTICIRKPIMKQRKANESFQHINCTQMIRRKERALSLAESEKISPKSNESPHFRLIPEQSFIDQFLNSNILDVQLQYSHEGLIGLRLKQNNQDMEIIYSNIASRALLSVNSQKEMVEILNSFTNLNYIYHENHDDYELHLKHSKQMCTKSMAFLKSDHINQSPHNQDVIYLFQAHSDKNSVPHLKDIFDKFQSDSFNESFIIHVLFPINSVTMSQSEKQVEKLLELTLIKKHVNLYFMLIRDITHKQKIRYLKEYDIQKSKMLSYVSHEYRSPLNCIIQMIEDALHSNQLSNDLIEILQAALDNSNYILNLSNDLLDLAQIKNGKFAIQRSKFNLIQLIKEVLKLFELKAKITNINLSLSFDNAVSSVIVSDRNRIKQILVNLVSNSFKFASSKIIISVTSIDSTSLRIGVQDDGIGISEEDQKKLFKSFSKVNSEESAKRNEQGVGLGLVISNQIAISIGCGGLQIDSKQNQGTYFYFDLHIQTTRLKKVSSFRIKEISASFQEVDEGQTFHADDNMKIDVEPPLLRCKHMLLVDDEVFNIFTFTKILNKKNITDIDSASNGNECIQKVKNKKCSTFCTGYRIIFMDLEMPILNGLNAAKQLLQLNPNQTIVACSGYIDNFEKENCLKIGMIDYLVKPIRDQELTFVLNTYYF